MKTYPWYEFDKATEESGKSLAELFDFETGTLIWKKSDEENMKTYTEIQEIAKQESKDGDPVHDINNEDVSRAKLWISAFRVGYEMGQAGVECYADL